MNFGEKLQMLRKEKGWTQEQLADQIRVSRQALSKWELGTALPDTENVLQISRLFGVSTDALLKDDLAISDGPKGDLSAQMRQRRHDKIRVVTGICLSGTSLLGMLILGILSSVFPAVYVVAPVGVDWVRAYPGLWGFLKTHNLEWLFALCLAALAIGAVTIWYPRCKRFVRTWKNRLQKQRNTGQNKAD